MLFGTNVRISAAIITLNVSDSVERALSKRFGAIDGSYTFFTTSIFFTL